MKSILQMVLAKYKPQLDYVGAGKYGFCFHVTLPPTATEEDIEGAREGCKAVGYITCVYTTQHSIPPQPHFGVFSGVEVEIPQRLAAAVAA